MVPLVVLDDKGARSGEVSGTIIVSAAGSLTLVTTEAGIVNNGGLDWGVLGAAFTDVNNPFTVPVPGIPALTITGSQDLGTRFGRVDQSPVVPVSVWAGNFAPGERLLSTGLDRGPNGPMEFLFNSDISGFGVQIQADVYGAFTAFISAYDVNNNLLGTFSRNGNSTGAANDTAIFIGVISTLGNIRRIVLSVPTAVVLTETFAINSPRIQQPGGSPTLGAENWSTDQYDSSRTGRSPHQGPVLGTEAWSVNLANSSSASIGPDGKLWQTVSYSGPGRAFKLQAFWPDGLPAVDKGPFQQDPGPISFRQDGGFYVAARARIYPFTADGDVEWFVDTIDPGPSSPAVRPDGSFVVSIRNVFCPLNEVVSFDRNGNRLWQRSFGDCQGLTTVALTPDGDVIVAHPGLFGFVYRLDGLTGEIEWSHATAQPGPPSVSKTGRIFFIEGTDSRSADSQVRLVALNPDGSSAWQSDVLGVSLHSPVSIHSDDGVSVVTTDFNAGSMATLRRFLPDGTPSWTRALVPVTSGGPLVLIDGAERVFVALEENTTADPAVALIQAFDSSGQPLWHHDAQFMSWTIIGDHGTLYTAVVDALGYRLIAFKD